MANEILMLGVERSTADDSVQMISAQENLLWHHTAVQCYDDMECFTSDGISNTPGVSSY